MYAHTSMSAFVSSYNVNIAVIGCNANMEKCEYIISGHTFELRAVTMTD